MAKTCKSILRNVNLVARIGGEESAVMLPETSPDLEMEIAERLCLAIGCMETALPSGTTVAATVSIGLATYEPADVELDKMLARADAALYASKHAGRNRVTSEAAKPTSLSV